MAKIYVADKNIERAKSVMNRLQEDGHTITFDWTKGIKDEDERNIILKARQEREAVRSADILVYLWEPNQESARYEAGMAIGLGKVVIISGSQDSFFFSLPEIIKVSSDEEIYPLVKKIGA